MLEVMARWEVTLIGKKGHRYGMVGVNRFLRATPPGPGLGPNFACTTWAANGPSGDAQGTGRRATGLRITGGLAVTAVAAM